MRTDKTLVWAAALAALAACAPAARAADSEAALSAALAQARAAVAASPAKAASSCADAKELETPFELSASFADGRAPLELRFEYAGCREEERNDYLPPYTERLYKGADGYGLVVTTNEGESQSDVLVSKGQDWVGRFGLVANAALLSGDPVPAGEVEVKDAAGAAKGQAALRDAAKPLYPQLKTCEGSDWSGVASAAPRRDAAGKPALGYAGSAPSLVLLTKTAAYYYHENCDICAEVTKCDLATGRLSSAVAAHAVGCDDMKPYAKDAVYDACAGAR